MVRATRRAVAAEVGRPAAGWQGAAGRLAAGLASHHAAALAALIVLYTAACTGLNLYRMQRLQQGFDFLIYAQPVWNTLRGRPFAQSLYSFAPTHFGVDLTLFEIWLVPFYALWPSHAVFFLLVSLGAGLAALPLFLLARERYGALLPGAVATLVALGWAALYLIFLPVNTLTLYEAQPRLTAASALLGAFWFARRGRALPFWVCLLLAITIRSDVGLVVGCLGLYHLLERRPWPYSVAPAIFGFGYWALAVFVIVPALASGHGYLYIVNYAWLGASTREIARTILTDPLFVARGVFTLEKARYLAQLFWPLACLPLLRPRLLLIPLPVFAMNLLSGELVQFDLFHQYQSLIVPFLTLAALYGLADLREADRAGRKRRLGVLAAAAVAATAILLPVWPGAAASRNGLHPGFAPLLPLTLLALFGAPLALGAVLRRRARAAVPAALCGLLVLMILQHLALGSEVLRFVKNPGPSPRLDGARSLIARIPPDAPLAVTTILAVHVPLREQLYHFPGNSSYDPALVPRARFILGDRLRSPEERAELERLVREGGWRQVAEADDFVLLERQGS